jgi:hypothetical protein
MLFVSSMDCRPGAAGRRRLVPRTGRCGPYRHPGAQVHAPAGQSQPPGDAAVSEPPRNGLVSARTTRAQALRGRCSGRHAGCLRPMTPCARRPSGQCPIRLHRLRSFRAIRSAGHTARASAAMAVMVGNPPGRNSVCHQNSRGCDLPHFSLQDRPLSTTNHG